MSEFEPLDALSPPDWLGTALAGTGQAETGGLDTAAVGSDVAGGADEILPGDFGPMNEIGGIATFFAQYEQSIAKIWPLRLMEAQVAAAVDMQLGQLVVAGPLAPLVPILDTLVLSPMSRARGLSLGLADNINGALRGLTGLLDARLPGGGGEESTARARVRGETNQLGELARLVTAALHKLRGTDLDTD